MNKFAILADTSQDYTFEDAEKYGFYLVSYYVTMGGKTYKDLVDLDNKTFYQTMGQYDSLKTSIPSPDDVEQAIAKIKEDGYTDILCCTSASVLTGMYNLACLIRDSHPELNMMVFDTESIAMGTGLHTMRAIRLRDQGYTLQETYDDLVKHKAGSTTRALFRTLKYVIKGGRLTPLKGTLGMLLRINPLLKIVDGQVTIMERIRGRQKSLDRLIEVTKEELAGNRPYYLAIFAGDNDEELAKLEEALQDEIARADFFIKSEFTPVLGVHAGPQAIGAGYYFVD